jgi:hypothetical protein
VATAVKVKDGVGRVTYRGTDVVTWDKDSVTLATGGWSTATTKTRMNQAANQFDLGYRVFQRHWNWYVETKAGICQFISGVTFERSTGKWLVKA